MPTEAQVDAVERAFARWPEARELQPVSDHVRQYAGFMDVAGRKRIYLNGASKSAFARWGECIDARKPINVCDGGESFWGVEYDVESGALSDLKANGPRLKRK